MSNAASMPPGGVQKPIQTQALTGQLGSSSRSALLVSFSVAGLLLASAACKSAPASSALPAEPNPGAKLEGTPVQAAEPAKASAETDAYSVALKAPTSVKAGALSTLEVSVTPKAPFHCNMEYPYKLKLEPNPALALRGDAITKEAFQISAEGTKLQVPFTATKAGQYVVTGQLSFSVCKDDQCLVERQALSVAILAE
jgi:hypothetical protein